MPKMVLFPSWNVRLSSSNLITAMIHVYSGIFFVVLSGNSTSKAKWYMDLHSIIHDVITVSFIDVFLQHNTQYYFRCKVLNLIPASTWRNNVLKLRIQKKTRKWNYVLPNCSKSSMLVFLLKSCACLHTHISSKSYFIYFHINLYLILLP